MGLITEEDSDILQFFEKFKTIDIDGSCIYDIKPSIEEKKQSVIDEVLSSFSKQYHLFIFEKFKEIYQIPKIKTVIDLLKNKKNFKGLIMENDLEQMTYSPDIGFSVSIDTKYELSDSFEMRPQINSCIDNTSNCDHILEILTRNEHHLSDIIVYDLDLLPPFMGLNILKTCVQNIDRFYRTIKDSFEGTKITEKLIVLKVKNIFRQEPTHKIKYLQGYYRVQLIYLIVSRLRNKRSPKFEKLKSIFTIDNHLIRYISDSLTKNQIISILLPPKMIRDNIKFFSSLQSITDITLEDIELILDRMLSIWTISNDKILKSYKRNNLNLLEYLNPPEYSSNSLTPTQLHEEMGIDISTPNWEESISEADLYSLYKQLFKKSIPRSAAATKIIRNKIKKKLES